MNELLLSRRLERVAAQVPVGARLADIGSDHAYLPVALRLRGVIDAAVAGEVARVPFEAARRTVRENDLEDTVTVRLADGLGAIEPGDGITAISLCGMGGETIRDIVEAGQARLSGRERLILQPNGGEAPLRRWLMGTGYRIVHEEVLREGRFDYEVIVAEASGPVVYGERELYFGPLLLAERSPAFVLKWQRLLGKKRQARAQLQGARGEGVVGRQAVLDRQIEWIVEVLG